MAASQGQMWVRYERISFYLELIIWTTYHDVMVQKKDIYDQDWHDMKSV